MSSIRMIARMFFIVGVVVVVASCGPKKSASADGDIQDEKNWKEMDDFHMVMAESFHPYKDSADLGPAKSKVGELVASADKWANSPIPERVKSEEMKEQLQSLKSETEVLADLVQKGNEDAIGTQLTRVHDLFHKIQEAWYADEHHHDHK
jgi:hypothetical protein